MSGVPSGGTSTLLDDSKFKVEKPKQKMFGTVTMPASMSTPALLPPDADQQGESKSMWDKFNSHIETRNQLLNKNMNESEVDKLGYDSVTFEQFKKRNTTPEQVEKDKINKEKRLAEYMLGGNIAKYNNQGTVFGTSDVLKRFELRPGGSPSIFNLDTENLTDEIYMFSDKWDKVMG